MIALTRGGFELDIAPELGGAVTRFDCEGRPVLRAAPKGVTNPLDACVFPLVPYANRIEQGVLKFGGKEYRLPLNFGGHPHTLHGHGWQTAWRVETVAKDNASLAFDHAADAWPWAYTAGLSYALDDTGARFALTLRSRDDKPMPFSLGFHPYFPRGAASKITAVVAGMWRADATMLPTVHAVSGLPIDLVHGQVVSKAPFVDNAFTGWRGPARIEQPDLGLAITLEATSDCRFLHVFIPEGQTYFCAEPTTAMPNAFNRPEKAAVTGAHVLEPGAAFSIEMRLGVRKL
jgi:aldose 1-epimerase